MRIKAHHIAKGILITVGIASLVAITAPKHVGVSQAYPDSRLTPGMVATVSFQELTAVKACGTYSACHRKTTSAMKDQVCAEYPQNCQDSHHEIDHFCPLALGCADDVKNLWAEPEHIVVNGEDFGFHAKDGIETLMVAKMKRGEISPADAQNCILQDWIACMHKYIPSKNLGSIYLPDPDDDVQ